MKTINFLLPIFFLQINTNSQWFLLNSGTQEILYTANFINVNTGWIIGQSKIFKTMNGGINWVNQSPNNFMYARAGLFINENTGWVAGSADLILKTTNSGSTWFYQSAIANTNWHDIFFINDLTGWIVGTSGQIIKTTDGGNSWIRQISGIMDFLYSEYFIDLNTGWVVGDHGRIIKTTNSGNNWILQLGGTISDLKEVFFFDSNSGWIAGHQGIILKTTNGGNSWILAGSLGTTVILVDINFINNMTGWIIGSLNNGVTGTIILTTDGGNNWAPQIGAGPYELASIDMVNSSTGYIAGWNGTILKTTNGGAIGIKPISEIIPSEFKLYQNYPNPFNPSTNMIFDIPKSSYVKIGIYDLLGKEIAIIIGEYLISGTYKTSWNANAFSSGTYIIKLMADNFIETKKMVLMK